MLFFSGTLIFFLVLVYVVYRVVANSNSGETVAPITPIQEIVGDVLEPESQLLGEISEIVENEDGEYAVVVRKLDGGEEVSMGEDRIFGSASLYKLWLMAGVYKAVEEGKLTFDTGLSASVEELNEELEIATEGAELSEGEVSGTVAQLLHEMITVSGNYPAYLLARTVGMGNVATLMREYGWDDSSVGTPPKTTARDIADYFEKLYRGEIVSKEASEEMVDLLVQQRFVDRIPAELPENTRVAHKTGELDGHKHDAGIVYAPFGDYVIVMLSDTPSQEQAVEVQQEISRVVWEYFKNLE